MTKRHNIVVLAVAAVISVLIWVLAVVRAADHRPPFSARVFKSAAGWGYDILVNDTLLIHQQSVPGLQGFAGFPKQQQAEKMSQLIIDKMKRGEFPHVTTLELDQIYPADERSNSCGR